MGDLKKPLTRNKRGLICVTVVLSGQQISSLLYCIEHRPIDAPLSYEDMEELSTMLRGRNRRLRKMTKKRLKNRTVGDMLPTAG